MKIKDLSFKKIFDICLKYSDCNDCPLSRGKDKPCRIGHIFEPWYYDEEYLNKEVGEDDVL